MIRRGFLASLAGIAGCFSLSRLSVKAESLPVKQPLPINPYLSTPDRAYGLYFPPGEELDGLSPQAAFVLGVEWRSFMNQLHINPKPFRALVHPANMKRCMMAAREEYNRIVVEALPGAHAWAIPYERDWRVIEVGACPYQA